jgi:hypothetical protein
LKKNKNNTYTKYNLSISLVVVITGISTLVINFIIYPFLLPKIITEADSQWIEQSSYIFYIIFGLGIAIEIYGIYRILQYLNFKFYSENNEDSLTFKQELIHSSSSKLSNTNPFIMKKQQPISIPRIILNMINYKKYFKFFLPITLTYGFLYGIISGSLIIRLEGGISHISGIVDFPSLIMMQYGPMGYVPAIAIYFNDNFGIFILPLNLIVMIIVSSLVGINAISSMYAFANYYSIRKRKGNPFSAFCAKNNSHQFIGILGATTSLFAACPTCASFYIFNILSSSLAATVAAFTINYYIMFLIISIPLLVISPIITAFNIKRLINSYSNGQCAIRK